MIIRQNRVKIAVKRAGGPTKVSNLLGCSNGSVHSWMKQGRISDIDKARTLASHVGMAVEEIRPC